MNPENNIFREHTNLYFREQPIYLGDIVEWQNGRYKEISEVRKKEHGYYISNMETDLSDYMDKIIRVINMGGRGADGRYI
jgi:hypothetical protein